MSEIGVRGDELEYMEMIYKTYSRPKTPPIHRHRGRRGGGERLRLPGQQQRSLGGGCDRQVQGCNDGGGNFLLSSGVRAS